MKKNILLVFLVLILVIVVIFLFTQFKSKEQEVSIVEASFNFKTLIAPNEESPTWPSYIENVFQNEMFGKDIPSLSDNPNGIEVVTDGMVKAEDIIITPEFPSWRGDLSPEGNFANEKGNTVQILVKVIGKDKKIVPESLVIEPKAYSSTTSEVYFSLSGAFKDHIYDWRGRIYGEDGRGENDEITTDPLKPVDELVFLYGFRDFVLTSTESTNQEVYSEMISKFSEELPKYQFSVAYPMGDGSSFSVGSTTFSIKK